MANKTVVDCATGNVVQVPQTPAEVAAFQAAAAAPPAVPQVITMRQARLALYNAKVLDQVNAAVTAAQPPDQIWWEYSTEVHRQHPLVLQITAGLGMTSDQVDALFIAAAALP